MKAISKAAFETAIEEVILSSVYFFHVSKDFDAEFGIFPETELNIIPKPMAPSGSTIILNHA